MTRDEVEAKVFQEAVDFLKPRIQNAMTKDEVLAAIQELGEHWQQDCDLQVLELRRRSLAMMTDEDRQHKANTIARFELQMWGDPRPDFLIRRLAA